MVVIAKITTPPPSQLLYAPSKLSRQSLESFFKFSDIEVASMACLVNYAIWYIIWLLLKIIAWAEMVKMDKFSLNTLGISSQLNYFSNVLSQNHILIWLHDYILNIISWDDIVKMDKFSLNTHDISSQLQYFFNVFSLNCIHCAP